MTVPTSLTRLVHRDDRGAEPYAVWVAVALPLVFVTAFLIAGTRQPPHYSALQQTVSVMAGHAGVDRWIMNTALAFMAVGYGLLALGLRSLRTAGRILLGVASLAAFGILFSPQPAAGTTLRHGAWAALGEIVLTLWPLLAVTAEGGVVPRRVGRVVVATSFLLLAWLAWAVYRGPDLGLAERFVVTAQVCWPAVVAVTLYRRRVTAPAGDTSTG